MRRLHPLVLIASGLLTGCGTWTHEVSPPSTRSADLTTCAETTLSADRPAKLTPLDRTLVPYGDGLLGVETTFGDENRTVRVISGGYFDDIFEAYDQLDEIGVVDIQGTEATLLASSLLGVPIRALVWRIDLTAPCDARAVIATGLSDSEFSEFVTDLEVTDHSK